MPLTCSLRQEGKISLISFVLLPPCKGYLLSLFRVFILFSHTNSNDFQVPPKSLEDPKVKTSHLFWHSSLPSPAGPERKLFSLAPLEAALSHGLWVSFPGLQLTGKAETCCSTLPYKDCRHRPAGAQNGSFCGQPLPRVGWLPPRDNDEASV